jgi:tRNA (guanine26-N2/guanine27-N2)-dimethyltransferase
MIKVRLVETVEGSTRLLVPDPRRYGIPEKAPVFYNPRMAQDRDVSVKVLSAFLGPRPRVADVLCGLGARAVRYANECGATVTANDIQPSAVALARRNAALNKVKVATSSCDGNLFLLQSKYEKFDCVDIDPFGSPAEWLNAGFRAIKPVNGLICVTATDIGTLSGVYPRTCFRKYGLLARETSFRHELGVRNLVAVAFREGAKYSIAVRPLLAYANAHYYRAYLATCGGKKSANRLVAKNIGFISYCPKCERREILGLSDFPAKCQCGSVPLLCGPTWAGSLGDAEFLQKISFGNRLLEACEAEAGFPEPYWDIHALAKKLGTSARSMAAIAESLAAAGYGSARTHFSDCGLRSNAPYAEMARALKKQEADRSPADL